MKKVLLAFVMASTLFIGCQKDEVKKEEKKNYPENIAYTVWLSKTRFIGGYEAKMKLIFKENSVETNLISEINGNNIVIIPSSRPSYRYSEGKGRIIGEVDFGNGKVRMDNGKEWFLYTNNNKTYVIIDGNIRYLENGVSSNSILNYNDEFRIEGDVLYFDGTELIRQ